MIVFLFQEGMRTGTSSSRMFSNHSSSCCILLTAQSLFTCGLCFLPFTGCVATNISFSWNSVTPSTAVGERGAMSCAAEIIYTLIVWDYVPLAHYTAFQGTFKQFVQKMADKIHHQHQEKLSYQYVCCLLLCRNNNALTNSRKISQLHDTLSCE